MGRWRRRRLQATILTMSIMFFSTSHLLESAVLTKCGLYTRPCLAAMQSRSLPQLYQAQGSTVFTMLTKLSCACVTSSAWQLVHKT